VASKLSSPPDTRETAFFCIIPLLARPGAVLFHSFAVPRTSVCCGPISLWGLRATSQGGLPCVRRRATKGNGRRPAAWAQRRAAKSPYPRSCLPVMVRMSILTTAVRATFSSGNSPYPPSGWYFSMSALRAPSFSWRSSTRWARPVQMTLW
jgi:hypothetical protein